MTRRFVMPVAALVFALAGCGDPASNNDGGTDAMNTNDAAMDTGGGDTGGGDTGGGDTGVRDTGGGDTGGGMFGTCGATAHSCVCACGMNATCQQGCLTADMGCQMCVVQAQIQCCPTEAQAFGTCAQNAQTMASDAGPACGMDTNCIAMRCSREYAAFQSCVTTAAASSMACQNGFRACFGAYPIQCN